MSQGQTKLSRRNFLFAVGAGGAASAAAIVAKTVPQPQPQPAVSGDDKKKTKGYHASEHIRNYYRTTKV
ncbi:MAG: twin-arginine translocation signal domain-containing protein [Burkholderiales bacterium]